MNTRSLHLGRRLGAVVAAVALSMVGIAGAAHADDTTPVSGVGNIDASQKGSITIHKRVGDEGSAGDGSKLSTAPGEGLNGVTFSVQRVTAVDGTALDVTDSTAWDTISALTASQAKGGTLGAAQNVTTANGGIASLDGLDLGVYLVTETAAPSNVSSTTAPFLVTLPLPQSGGKWLYGVSVYPKNQVLGDPTKTVSDPDHLVGGSTVTWTISQQIPKLNAGDSFQTFTVTDDLDSRLELNKSGIVVKIDGATVAADDYAVSGNVVITFNAAGRALLAQNTTKTVTVSLPTKVNGTGEITNTAVTNVNGGKQTTQPAVTNWGKLNVLKHDSSDASKTLAGAEFDVFDNEAGTGTPIAHLVTQADGTQSIDLYVGKSTTEVSRVYSVKETKAPAGYVLDQQVRKVTVPADGTATVELSVANTQQGHPDLPLTGANGQLLATIGGVALVLLAAGSAMVLARRRRQH